MSWPRRLLILFGLVLVLGAANLIILQKQRVVDQARLVLLELRPVDPRSLMQGDYMDLAFADAVTRPPEGMELPHQGVVIVNLDEAGIARFARPDDGRPLAPDEARLRYLGRTPWGDLGFGSNAFFFQEGDAGLYADARYGMFRVDEHGNGVLVGLADEDRQPLGRSAD